MENKYTHIERLTSAEVEGILDGVCYFYPKLDGANASVELSNSGEIVARSRNSELGPHSTLRGFYEYVQQRLPEFEEFFGRYPNLIIFGEWLVPHTIKTYSKDAWHKFYVFDVYDKSTSTYLNFETFRLLADFECVPLLAKIAKPTPEQIDEIVKSNNYLLESGQSEGVVIKNYVYTNVYGRQPFAKVVSEHFGTKSTPLVTDSIEKQIVDSYLAPEYVLKEFNKLGDKSTPAQVIHVVYTEFIRDYISEILKKYKNPTINFRDLKKHIAKLVIDVIL